MNVLLIHQNFPGQFRHIAAHLAAQPGNRVLAVAKKGCPGLPGITVLSYDLHRLPAKETHHYAKPFEAGILYGQAVARLLYPLAAQGYAPDVILAHPGWGETLYIRDVFPHARLIHFCEYFYHPEGADAGFDPEFPLTPDDRARIRSKNALHLLNLENCDAGITPTAWQSSLHPSAYRNKIHVCHEGIDTAYLQPSPQATFTLPDGTTLCPGAPLVSYVARNLEPHRGFHVFMRALPEILARNPAAQVAIVGGDETSYGPKPADAPNWREKLLREVPLPAGRVHFLGKIPYPQFRALLQVSAAHVYLTYPFVLSWSMLEAMACGCLLIASDTAPVREVARDKQNALLVDFFDRQGLVEKVSQALTDPGRHTHLRRAAAQDIAANYPIEKGKTTYLEILAQQK